MHHKFGHWRCAREAILLFIGTHVGSFLFAIMSNIGLYFANISRLSAFYSMFNIHTRMCCVLCDVCDV